MSTKYEIPEVQITFELPDGWSFVSKTGKLEYGKVQYSFSHDHVQGEGRLINPTISVTVDKGSWFTDEQSYLEEKIGFHKSIDDIIKKSISPKSENNPLTSIKAYYTEAISGLDNNPYGQQLRLITFWTKEAGFHMEIHTSAKDLETNKPQYDFMIASIRKQ